MSDHRARAEQLFRSPVRQDGLAGGAMRIADEQARIQREKTERLKALRLAAQSATTAAVEAATRKARARRKILA